MRLIHRLLVAAALTITLAGCTAHTSANTAVSPEASNASAEAGRITPAPAASGRSSAVIGRNAVDPKDLGLPLYPGAIQADTGALLMHSKTSVSRVVSLSTKDDFDHVYQWYKQQMPSGSEQAHMAVPNGSVASFLIGRAQDPEVRSVLITQGQGKTAILLTRETKSGARGTAAP